MNYLDQIRLAQLEARVRELERGRDIYLDQFTNIGETTVQVGLPANQLGLAPLFLPAPIRLISIHAKASSLAGTVQGALALYRIATPDMFKRNLVFESSAFGMTYVDSQITEFDLVKATQPISIAAAAGRVRPCLYFDSEIVLDPRKGLWAVGWVGDSNNLVWYGGGEPALQTNIHNAFVGPVLSSVGSFPQRTSSSTRVTTNCPPCFLLQSIRGLRRSSLL